MKKIMLSLIIIIISGIAFIVLANGKPKTAKEDGILSVNDVQEKPAALKGVIRVTGVVAVVKGNAKQFALLDTAEAMQCKSEECARFYLPVQYGGKLPRKWDEVNITGSLVKEGGFIFNASRVDVLRHITFEGGRQ